MLRDYLLAIMRMEGLTEDKEKEVQEELDTAIKNGNIRFIKKDGITIGFMTYFPEEGKIFINNCVIFDSFRNRTNFLYLRDVFRKQFKGMTFYWESKKKHNKLCFVK